MSELSTWRELVSGTGDDVVLAIDFDATGRPEARFADLAPRLTLGAAVWETVPLGMEKLAGPSGESYVKRWAEEVRASGRNVLGVLGFCAGGAFAPTLAETIGQWQQTPQLILFDPEIVTPLTMYWQFTKVIEVATSSLTPAELAAARDDARRAQERIPDIEPLADELLSIFRRVGGIAFPRLGLDTERGEEVVALFASFIGYLCAAGQFDPLDAWQQATVVSSTSPTSGLNGFRQLNPGYTAALAASELVFDTTHATLLSNDEVASTASTLLASMAK
jgi:hypothetical protein